MRSVLIVTFLFPPSGGGGVQRLARFARYLPEFGWQPTVVAVEPLEASGGYWGRQDPALLEDLPEMEILHTRTWDPWFQRWPGKGLHYLLRVAGLPETLMASWLPFLLKRLLTLPGRYDAVLSSSPPVTTHLGAALARRLGRRWVTDYQDTWTTNPLYRRVSPFHAAVDRGLEAWFHRRADAVMTTTPGFRRDLLAAFPFVPPSKVHTIPNGYDASDPVQPAPPSADGRRVLALVVGNQYRPEVLEPLLQALTELRERHPESLSRLRVRVLGGALPGRQGEELRATGAVEEVPYRPHAELYREIAAADAGLVTVPPGPGADSWVPQKVLLYLHCRKPVVALCPKGDLTSLLEALRGGISARPGEGADLLHRWVQGEPLREPVHGELFEELERRPLAARLAALLEGRPLPPIEDLWPPGR